MTVYPFTCPILSLKYQSVETLKASSSFGHPTSDFNHLALHLGESLAYVSSPVTNHLGRPDSPVDGADEADNGGCEDDYRECGPHVQADPAFPGIGC